MKLSKPASKTTPSMIRKIAYSMSSVRLALQRVKRQLVVMRLFATFLNAALIFGITAPLFVLASLSWLYAFIPTLVYFVPVGVWRVREVKLKEAEERVPELEWQLRTTEDTLDKQNEVVESLHQRVLQKLVHLRNSYLLDQRVVGYKLAGIMGLLGVLVVLNVFHVAVLDITQPGGLTGLFTDEGAYGLGDVNSTSFDTEKGDRDIYGEEDTAKLGDEELELELNRENSELDYDRLGDVKGKEFSQQNRLGDVGASADSSYEEEIDEENQKLVKKYFENLAGVT